MAAGTADRVMDAALALFRKRGFDATTMRDIAAAAGLSLGAAYYYYPSKQALVLAYFRRQQATIEARATTALASARPGLGPRLAAALHVSIETLAPDRRFLGALFQTVADPKSQLSPFGAGTAEVRQRSIANLARVVPEGTRLPAPVAGALPAALWGLNMALILFMVNDRSKKQARTHRLIDVSSDLVENLVQLASLPGLDGLHGKVAEIAALIGARDAQPPKPVSQL